MIKRSKTLKMRKARMIEMQQVSKVDDDNNNDDFDCSFPPHKGADLTVENVVFENTTSDLKKDKDEQDVDLFDNGISKEPHCKSNLDVHLQFHVDQQDIGSQVKTWVHGIKIFLDDTLKARWFRRSEECYALGVA
ncbi:hypothetical protein Tco_1538494 [Tanacetum coccineum]